MKGKKIKLNIFIIFTLSTIVSFKLKTIYDNNINDSNDEVNVEYKTEDNKKMDNPSIDDKYDETVVLSNNNENNTHNASSNNINNGNEIIEESEIDMLKKSDKSYLILVNHKNNLKNDYVPELRSANIDFQGSNESKKLQPIAATALEDMFAAAKVDGFTLIGMSGYRSYWTQNDIYNNNVNRFGEERANIFSAKPGQSEHQTGLAMDIGSSDFRRLHQDFQYTNEYKWLIENCYKYGFILRYTSDATNITGYMYEPWHYRYVGVDHATYIMKNNITLEEYIELLEQ